MNQLPQIDFMSKFTPPSYQEVENKGGNFMSYGKQNDFPDYLNRMAVSSPVHGSLCKSISDIIAGKEWTGQGAELISKKDRRGIASDLKVQGGFYVECFWSLDKSKIAKIEHLPFDRCRLAAEDQDEIVNGIYYSRNWEAPRGKYAPVFLKKYDSADRNGSFALWGFTESPGMEYYPKPDYMSGRNYVELSEQISEFHINNILNSLFPSVIVAMINGAADQDEKDALKAMLSKSQGAKNSGKWFTLWVDSKENLPTITPVPVNDADKQYQFLATESRDQILIAHRVTSPLLFGVRDGNNGLGSNTDEIRASYALFEHNVVRPFQRVITDTFAEIGMTIEITPNLPAILEAAPAVQAPVKMSKAIEMTDADSAAWLAHLEKCGETVDLDEWEVVEECFAGSMEDEIAYGREYMRNIQHKVAAEDKSAWGDSGLYKLRYRYSTNITADSRSFCKRMVDLSVAGVLYRKEDIDVMSDRGVNSQFAPEGQSSYDIFEWKGGVYCHHKWVRVIFVRKRGADGKILPPSKTGDMENDKRVGNNPYVPKKGDEGVAPINTATRGSLKYA